MEHSSRKRSALWNHFSETGPKKAKCSYCAKELSISCGNVGNLGRHLKTTHPTAQLVEERQQTPVVAEPGPSRVEDAGNVAQVPPISQVRIQSSQPSIREFTQSTKPLPPKRAQQIDTQLLKMIATGHYPLRMVEDPQFKKFVALLNPQYQLPTRKTLSESILPKQYNECKEKVKADVKKAQSVCLATDGWTSVNNDSFIAVTVHYIDPAETKIKSNLLGCVEYNERHTSANLTAFLRDNMAEWNIANSTTAIASDNAANISAAIKEGSWRQIPCFAHSLNLCVQTALTHLAEPIAKVKSVVEYFKRSSHVKSKLQEMQNSN